MANQTTKRCHWVPQSYLRPFAAENSKRKIWRLSKVAGSDPELKRIDKVAVEFYLYSPKGVDGSRNDALERKLAGIENWFGGPVWKKLCNAEVDLTWEPMRKMLALLIATTYVRNPSQFDQWKSTHSRFVEMFSEYDDLPTHVTIDNVEHKVDESQWPKFRDAGEDSLKSTWNDYIACAGDIAPTLLKMRMTMCISQKPAFITSDNPVTIIHPSMSFEGISDPDTAIIFPISPTRSLRLDNRHNEPDGVYYAPPDDHHALTNALVWKNSLQYMFSPRNPIDVCREINAAADNRSI